MQLFFIMVAVRISSSPSKSASTPGPLWQVCCTRWGKDELARGSYSSMAVGALGGDDYDILGESLGDRVFFAGESTNRKYPATMHGAFYSGTREVRVLLCEAHEHGGRRLGILQP